LHNAAVEPICRQYLDLRYQLMPYTYTITREARDTGLPLMRALWLHYSDDPKAVTLGSEYLWGRDILVAPVTQPSATNRVVYLPKGDWYDWWTSEKTTGGREVVRQVDLNTMPLYVRAGAIIPFDPVRQYMDEPASGPTTLRVYRGADGHFVLYDDDGTSQDYLKPGAGIWTEMTWNDSAKRLDIKLDQRTQSRQGASRQFDVLLLPDNQRHLVNFAGRDVQVVF
jgi:alpha-glucosidase/alpha-D-xyloside xylohydrolase